MFLILGIQNCKFCQCAKDLLDNQHIPYLYYDVQLIGGSDWRATFKLLFPTQHTFPVIFNSNVQPQLITLEVLKQQPLIGNYFDLEDYLNDTSDEIVLNSSY
jgi:glutaredoxin